MNKKKIITISSVTLFIFLVIFVMMQKGTFSSEEYKYVFNYTKEISLYKNELQELVKRTSKAFYHNSEFIKYKSGNMFGDDGINYNYRDFTVSPEELNKNNMVYMDDASFIYSVYINALGIDLSEGLSENFNLETGYGFDIKTILKIIESKDKRLVLENNETSYNEQEAFISKYLKTLEVGDIVVYSLNDEKNLALYLGMDQDNSQKCIYFDEKGNSSGIYMHDVNNLLFPNNKFLGDNAYYAIIRPINNLEYNPQDRTVLNVPVNSLARIDDVYVRRYTDVSYNNVYRGEIINFTIEVTNDSDDEKSIDRIVDIVNNYLEFVSVKDGLYDDEDKVVIWNNIKLAGKETRKFTYTVKVNGDMEFGSIDSDETVYGKNILAGNAKILFNADSDVLSLNTIKYTIANRYIDEQEIALNNVFEQLVGIEKYLTYNEESFEGYKTNISDIAADSDILLDSISFNNFIYYNAFGVDLGINGFNNYDSIRDAIFVKDEHGIYTRNDVNLEDSNSVNINKMLVSNLYGGMSLSDNNKSKIFSPIKDGKYTYSNLVSGDIIIYWDKEGNPFSYFVDKEVVDDQEAVKIYNFSKQNGVVEKSLDSRIESILNESSLYVVLRPSMILDIELKDVQIDPINLNLDKEKKIIYVKKPINATINSISFSESNLFTIDSESNMIKGVKTGIDMLTVTFNGDIKKNVSVSVLLAIMDDIFVTDYQYDKENKIFYVGNERDVKTILEEIKFVSEGYEARIVDSNYQEVLETINDMVSLEVKYNSNWIGNYKIVYFSLNDEKIQVMSDEKIIKYISLDTKVTDLNDLLYINDKSVTTVFYNSDNEKLSDDEILSTGDYWVFKVTDNIEEQYQISVIGDVSGNGIFNGNDIVLTRRHIVGWKNPQNGEIYELSGVYEYAMDFSMNGIVNGNDVSSMRRKLVN